MESFLNEEVLPEEWSEWPRVPMTNLFYEEFNNRGSGANVSKMVLC